MPAFGLLPSQRLPSPCVGFQITLSIPLKGIISQGGWIADIYLTKTFQAFAAHERISDATVIKAAREIQNKLYDANLGSCVYTKRVARAGGGKRGGYRVLIAFREEEHLFFMRGFAKKMKRTISLMMSSPGCSVWLHSIWISRPSGFIRWLMTRS
ncbi:type II toxin-antitoxin system RelE/ParE family toxin [Serratia sp. PL17]|uniref:type II toxin-antitoxin system RelE/ParE family toxin n=1 Tax=Serratia sp. PL17 TaxID=2806582 RepID=UPI001FD74313|nr:type II toxin-antitoxin system RelE/ParE family toxin [Serratia sp. PL17]